MPEAGGLTTAGAFIDAFRTSSIIAREKEQSRRADAQLDIQQRRMAWEEEDRQYAETLRPIEEERLKLGNAAMALRLTGERLSLKGQRRQIEADMSMAAAMEMNDDYAEQALARLDQLRLTPAGQNPAADDELVTLADQLADMAKSGAFTSTMQARIAGASLQIPVQQRLKQARESKFVRDGISQLQDLFTELKSDPKARDEALDIMRLPVSVNFDDPESSVKIRALREFTPDQLSGAIDRLSAWNEKRSQPAAQSKAPSLADLRQIAADENQPAAIRAQAAAVIQQQLSQFLPAQMPGTTGAAQTVNPLLPPLSQQPQPLPGQGTTPSGRQFKKVNE